ncbi:hypothetical protein J8M97_02895 [Gordonia polyisoprenivorans]|nr:hypothetical protein J8M97_02895 [Gordonia polyisoprenivorans]
MDWHTDQLTNAGDVMNTGILDSSATASSATVGIATASTREFSVPTGGLSRFLTPGDRDWNDDGAGTWIAGYAGGLTYTLTADSVDSRLTLHNRGRTDLAVLSIPGFTAMSGARLTPLSAGSSATLPDNEFHVLQAERRGGRPVIVGQIVDDGEPAFLIHPPRPDEVDWLRMPGADEFWTPYSPAPSAGPGQSGGASRSAAEPHSATGFHDATDAGVCCESVAGMAVVHNRGPRRIAVLMTGLGGAFDLVVALPGESIPIPPGPGIHYVHAARDSGRPVVVDVIHVRP